LNQYYENLDESIKSSLAPINLLIDQMQTGYDPHYLVLKSNPKSQRI